MSRLPLGPWFSARHGAPYWAAHRGDLYRVLSAAAGADPLIEVRTGFQVAAVTESAAQVTVADKAGRRLSAPLLVGADGLWSAVRQVLVPACAPRPAGATATRTVIPADRAGPLARTAVGLWLSPEAHVVHYPVRGGREIALVIIARETAAAERRGWDGEVDAAGLRRRLAPFHAGLREILMPGSGPAWSWREWTLYTLPSLPMWGHARTVLIGDAAHPMLPYLAQGGALALEDAVVLAHCLQAAADDPGAAVARFHELRARRVRRVQAASVRQGRIYGLAPPLSWARDLAFRVAPGSWLMAGLDWLYGWHPPST